MKTRHLCGLAAIAAAFALPAQAEWFHHHDDRTTTYNNGYTYGPGSPDGNPIHTAANNPDDQMLADQVADALRSDRSLKGATVTVAANAGRVSLAGSAASTTDAYRIENIASAVAGRGRVAGSIDVQGGG
jgi:hypothetical protein